MALFWPYAEQFSPSQISFHHSKKRCNIMVWRFCRWNMKKWKAMPLGLIIFLLFNKYLGIVSVLESKRHLTYAGHLAALMGNGSLLSPTLQHIVSGRFTCFSSAGRVNKGRWWTGCWMLLLMIFFSLARIMTSEDNWWNPSPGITYYIIFFVHEKKHLLQEINSSSSVFPMHQREN